MGKHQLYRSGDSIRRSSRAAVSERGQNARVFDFYLPGCLRNAAGVVLLLSATAVLALGQAQQAPLNLDDCVRLAGSAPSSVTVARQQSEIARYGLIQARAGFLPQARVNNLVTYNSPLLYDRQTFSFVALNGIREYSFLFAAGQEVDISGRLRAVLARARADQDAASANLGLTQRDLRRAVSAAYYHLLLSRRLTKVTRASLSEAQSFEQRTRLLAEKGEVAQADVVKASAQVAFLEQAVSTAELEAKMANHELASFWTVKVDDLLDVVDILDETLAPPPDSTTSIDAPFTRRLEFDFLDAQRRGLLADSRRARADLLPQANFVFQYGVDSLQAHIRDRGYAAFVNLNIPVFDWFKSLGASRQFQQQAQQVATNRQIVERAFSREYQDALERAKVVYSQISMAQSQVKLSEQNLQLSRVRYEGGEGSALDVVAAQNQLAQAQTSLYTTLANYLNARVELEIASGR
jgi:outer membrane protein TolC